MGRFVARPAFWICVIGLLFGFPFVRGLRSGTAPPPPPLLDPFPEFSLRDEAGRLVSLEEMKGHAFLANQLCTGCGIEGSQAAETMRVLQHRSRNLGDALRLVSFSPDGDAATLSALRRKRPASQRWILLAGAPPRVAATLGTDLVLVDQKMRIRGRYPFAARDALSQALRDAAMVLNSE